MHIEKLGEIFPPPSHNTVGACNQVTFLILYYIPSRLVPHLKVIDAPIQVPNVFVLLVSSSSILALRYASFFVPEMSANFMSYIVQIIYVALAWILYPLHVSPLPLMQKTTVHAASIRVDLDSLSLRF